MLGYLASHRGRAVSREEILTRVWRLDLRGRETRIIDVHIANLRAKLRDDAESPKVLLTVRALIDRLAPRLAARAEQADLILVTDTNTPAATAKLAIDVSAVEQILFNLVDNACKYAGPDTAEKRHHEYRRLHDSPQSSGDKYDRNPPASCSRTVGVPPSGFLWSPQSWESTSGRSREVLWRQIWRSQRGKRPSAVSCSLSSLREMRLSSLRSATAARSATSSISDS